MIKNNDELVFLGSGGGRMHVRTQHRATGGILYKFKGIQAHIDPGPGAIVRINEFNEDPTKTDLIIVTHLHTDHFTDMWPVIECTRVNFRDQKRNLVKKGTLISTQRVIDALYYLSENHHAKMLENIVTFEPGDKYNYKGIEITGTKVLHAPNEGFGVRFKLEDYTIAFSSDTQIFDDFSEQFRGVNILVLNLLRPDSVVCRRHLCTDEVIPHLNKIVPTPNALILTHFGAYMDSPTSKKNFVPSQVEKLKEQTKIKNIIAAEDGLKLKISELLK